MIPLQPYRLRGGVQGEGRLEQCCELSVALAVNGEGSVSQMFFNPHSVPPISLCYNAII